MLDAGIAVEQDQVDAGLSGMPAEQIRHGLE
jgi:hypothetical protein